MVARAPSAPDPPSPLPADGASPSAVAPAGGDRHLDAIARLVGPDPVSRSRQVIGRAFRSARDAPLALLVSAVLVVLVVAVAVLAVVLVSRPSFPPSPAPDQAVPAGPVGDLSRADASREGTAPTDRSPSASMPPSAAEPAFLYVAAAGAVLAPGLYRLPAGARVSDLIRAAGGLTPEGDPDRINLAARVDDGMRVYVPRRGETGAPPAVSDPDRTGPARPPGGAADAAPGVTPVTPVDINRATAQELEQLPGVGPATAAAIVAHRDAHGAFTTVEELQEVHGIGPGKLAQLRGRVTV